MDELFRCPISHEIMNDPVTTSDGFTYERNNIVKWFINHDTSPMTNVLLSNKNLMPNISLKQIIECYKESKSVDNISTSVDNISNEPVKFNINQISYDGMYASSVHTNSSSMNLNLVLVLDISGSMNEASKKVSGDEPSISRINLVKYSINTIVELLRTNDTLTLFTFSNDCNQIISTRKIDNESKQFIKNSVNKLYASGSTNFWSGLTKSVNYINTNNNITKNDNNVIMILTDGEPTDIYNPPSGIIETFFEEYDYKSKNISVHTCAFGYDPQSQLLFNLANRTNGSYYFIPDGSMVGTIFVHAISNMMLTVSKDMNLLNVKKDQKYILLDVKLENNGNDIIDKDLIMCELYREYFVDLLKYVMTKGPYDINVSMTSKYIDFNNLSSKDMITKLYNIFNDILNNTSSPIIKNFVRVLMDDMIHYDDNRGQIMKSIENWDKWGRHYLPSLYCAHVRREKINFKDQSMLIYSTPILDEYIKKGQEIFKNIKVPENDNNGPIQLQSYMDQYGGCFGPNTHVKMNDGSYKLIRDIKKGDVLANSFIVKCLIRYDYDGPIFYKGDILSDNIIETFVTLYHPFRVSEKYLWLFPKNESQFFSYAQENKEVYNLILENGHYIVSAGNFEYVTLAHGFKNDTTFEIMSLSNVIEHPYYGTNRIIEDLKKFFLVDFYRGYIDLTGYVNVRDPNTGYVSSLKKV